MKEEIKQLIRFYEAEIEECNEQLYYFPNQSNERIEGVMFAYHSILDKLNKLIK